MKRICFTVTNDLCYDQRMQRICRTLTAAGYQVTLIGRKFGSSPMLGQELFAQVRLGGWFPKGKLFYLEFNLRLFFCLLFRKTDAICAIDLDTILASLWATKLKNVRRAYDAHELFCEMKEVVSRPLVYRTWKAIEKYAVPKFPHGYTVSDPIAEEYRKMYGVNYGVVRNMPLLTGELTVLQTEKFILYQGAVNEGRSFETLIPAMKAVDARLIICGDGNFMDEAQALVTTYGLQDKIIFKGRISPEQLTVYTRSAWIGITLFEATGKSNYYSLANRFFDYMHAGIPQICVAYPAYLQINEAYRVALLIEDLSPEMIARSLNNLLKDDVLYEELKNNCMTAKKVFNWQHEESKLIHFYHQLFS